MQTPVEIRYAGVVVARAEVRALEGAAGLFLVTPEPLPVGTIVGLGADEARAVVERVVESADAAQAGMQVRPLQEGEVAYVPPPAAPSPPAPEPPPAVVEPLADNPVPVVVAMIEPTPAPIALAPPPPSRPVEEPAPDEAAPPAAAVVEAPAAPVVEPAAPPEEPAAAAPAVVRIETVQVPAALAEPPAVEVPAPAEDLPPARPVPQSSRRGTRKRRK